jgi:hypothetical protein
MAEIDRSMRSEDLDLRTIARNKKRELVRWIKQEGSVHEFLPQHIMLDMEQRRVERIRKRAEGRMFSRMNEFFNSLSLEDIRGAWAAFPTSEAMFEQLASGHGTTPFEKVMNIEVRIGTSFVVIRDQLLTLLKQRDPKLHTLYENYIKWCDYNIRKWSIWFSFPDTHIYWDLVSRIKNEQPRPLQDEDVEPDFPDEDTDPDIKDKFEYPIPSIPPSNYLGRSENNVSPFFLNETFVPWRPLSHRKRMQMFDAWREGLGLRNVAWLGGVSWRRVDGVVGILKQEWEFVKQVCSPFFPWLL